MKQLDRQDGRPTIRQMVRYYFHRYWRYFSITKNPLGCFDLVYVVALVSIVLVIFIVTLLLLSLSLMLLLLYFLSLLLIMIICNDADGADNVLFCRLTPVYAIVIMVLATFTYHWISGPFATETLSEVERCKNNWWANLLYIQNFYKPEEMVSNNPKSLTNFKDTHILYTSAFVFPLLF